VLDNLNGKPIPNSSKTLKLNWASFGGNNTNLKGNFVPGNKNEQSNSSQEYSVNF
jgi:hypothetical protein